MGAQCMLGVKSWLGVAKVTALRTFMLRVHRLCVTSRNNKQYRHQLKLHACHRKASDCCSRVPYLK